MTQLSPPFSKCSEFQSLFQKMHNAMSNLAAHRTSSIHRSDDTASLWKDGDWRIAAALEIWFRSQYP